MWNIRLIKNIALTTLLIALFTSCFESGIEEQPVVPTEAREIQILNAFLDTLHAQGHNVDTTDLGIYYVVIEEGEGNYPVAGDTLEVGYAGYFPDGKLFDASDLNEEDGTYEFILGNPPMLEGWDNGMTVINKNAIVQIIVPSKYAYGSVGGGIIPAYQTLIFVVEMKNIRPVL